MYPGSITKVYVLCPFKGITSKGDAGNCKQCIRLKGKKMSFFPLSMCSPFSLDGTSMVLIHKRVAKILESSIIVNKSGKS